MTKKSSNLKKDDETLPVLLTQEQIATLNEAECRRALERLDKEYPMDTPLQELPIEIRQITDLIGNTLLWLEDRLKELAISDQMTKVRQGRTDKELNTERE